MFKGIYNGKQHHVSDIATVLGGAWNAGVDRIIVSYSPSCIIFAFNSVYLFIIIIQFHRKLYMFVVTGGSHEESKEALAIAETDGRLFCTVGVHPTLCNEFEESGDPEKHFQDLLALAKEGIQRGKTNKIMV
ncbi:putative deoxyribonuclease TATDN1 [Hibiscus syriacus]|uniref:putative deoxyribonuclease TATDN1 n=1 Tax=Hibiscus syriacus TaxID=106335 RepID=UPI00192361AB|nr:putative deoxyribonuclease TATDN1 [Hibiscus syriacus]